MLETIVLTKQICPILIDLRGDKMPQQTPAMLENPADFPEIGTVLAIKTPLGPGDITSNVATNIKIKICIISTFNFPG
jgi:hypothetical protein